MTCAVSSFEVTTLPLDRNTCYLLRENYSFVRDDVQELQKCHVIIKYEGRVYEKEMS